MQANWIFYNSCEAECSVFGPKGTSRQKRTTVSVIIVKSSGCIAIVCTPFFIEEIKHLLQVWIAISVSLTSDLLHMFWSGWRSILVRWAAVSLNIQVQTCLSSTPCRWLAHLLHFNQLIGISFFVLLIDFVRWNNRYYLLWPSRLK